MQRVIVALAALVFAANASACPALDALVKRYGISFGGFMKPIPAVSGPAFSANGRLVRVKLAYPPLVSDGFRHTLVFDTATRKAWILRTGGFVGVREWYGPVDAGEGRLEDCRSQPEPELVVLERPRKD